MSTDTVTGWTVPCLGESTLFNSPMRCLNRRYVPPSCWNIRPSLLLSSKLVYSRQSALATRLLVMGGNEKDKRPNGTKGKSLKRRSAMNRRFLKRLLREPSTIGVLGALVVTVSIEIFLTLIDPVRAQKLAKNLDQDSLVEKEIVDKEEEEDLHEGETLLKDVDLEAMDDTIEYMDNSIREIPTITLRTPAETDLSLKHMTTSVSGEEEKDGESTPAAEEAVDLMTQSVVAEYCVKGEERFRLKDEDSESALFSLDSTSLDVIPSDADSLDEEAAFKEVRGSTDACTLRTNESAKDEGLKWNLGRLNDASTSGPSQSVQEGVPIGQRRRLSVRKDASLLSLSMLRRAPTHDEGQGGNGNDPSSDTEKQRLSSIVDKNESDRFGKFSNYLIPMVAGILVGSVAMGFISGTAASGTASLSTLATSNIADHDPHQYTTSRRSIYDDFEFTDESDIELEEGDEIDE